MLQWHQSTLGYKMAQNHLGVDGTRYFKILTLPRRVWFDWGSSFDFRRWLTLPTIFINYAPKVTTFPPKKWVFWKRLGLKPLPELGIKWREGELEKPIWMVSPVIVSGSKPKGWILFKLNATIYHSEWIQRKKCGFGASGVWIWEGTIHQSEWIE